MQIVFAVFTALGGLVAVVAGLHGLYRTRRVTRSGHYAIALVKSPPPGAERPSLAYETRDGRIMEIVSPVPLPAGTDVRLAYDPDDPREVVVAGHERTGVDRGFVAAGLVIAAVGLLVAVLGA
ncbi:DUF3592 domain-containing protein [Streptomyces sp. NPDC000594]|uniref:DUF3592 domain-containing protein n=1 Tax=Streptomyces sp. NPDC000594 TaxID=3154261 RepID=UPI003332E2F9